MFLESRKHRYLALAITSFWYLSLFPGRLGFDYAELARMIRRGESTAWWGASYFWFFKWLTFNTSSIALISLLSLLILTWSVYSFIDSLPLQNSAKAKVFLIVIATPFVGVFGLTVSHDVLQSSGLIFLTSMLLKKMCDVTFQRHDYLAFFLAGFCLTTTQYGLLIFVSCSLFFWRAKFLVLSSITFVLLVYFSSNTGIENESKSLSHLGSSLPRSILIDLKCIAQHPQAEILPQEWVVLEKYSSIENWKNPVTCSSPDILAAALFLEPEKLKMNRELITTFVKIVSRQPAIPFMSHVQRSSVALPPPFFQPPQNQISWDVLKPLGMNTNVALQEGPELLHPSIDDERLAQRPKFLRSLELFALLPTFIVNQASWFWGWGGLWLWPFLIFLVYKIPQLQSWKKASILTPTLLLHLILFAAGPTSLGRYVMSTIIMGICCLITMIPRKSSI